MSAGRKYAFSNRSMSVESRRSAYGKINILWKQMRPDLHFETKDVVREERLAWIASLLGLKRLESTTTLTDGQIGLVLDEMQKMSGQASKQPENNTKFKQFNNSINSDIPPSSGADVIHLTSKEQLYTLEKLETHIGWTAERREKYLKPRFNRTNFKMLKFAQANALTIQMLNIAAHKDLKQKHGSDTKITRQMTAKYIPVLKRKLDIK